jgi:hypothetical protein
MTMMPARARQARFRQDRPVVPAAAQVTDTGREG